MVSFGQEAKWIWREENSGQGQQLRVVFKDMVAINHMWIWNTYDEVAKMTNELTFKFHLI